MRNFFKALIVLMGITVSHNLSATTPDDPAYEIQVKHWNSAHAATINAVGSEISGAFGNGGGVTFGLSADGNITAAGPVYQATGNYLTTARASNDAIGLNTAKTNVTWTANSSGLSIDAGGYAGTGFTSTSTAGVDVKATHNTAGLSMAVPAYLTTAQPVGNYLTTARASNDAVGLNTAKTAVTWTVNSSGISLDAGAYLTTARASNDAVGLNTAKTAVTWTVNSSGISLDAGAYLTTARGSTDAIGLNTAKTNVTWTVNSSGLSLNAAGYAGTGTSATNASITLDTNGLQISVAAPGGGADTTISSYANMAADGLQNLQTQSVGQSTSVGVAFQLPNAISASFLRLPHAVATASTAIASTASSANASGELYTTWNAVVYSQGSGASSRSLMSEAKGSMGQTFRNSVSIAANGSQYSITQALSFRAEGGQTTASTQYSASSSVLPLSTTFFSAAFTGSKFLDIDFANSLKAGPKWLVLGMSTSSATNSAVLAALTNCRVSYGSHYAASMVNSWWGVMGSTNHTSGGLMGVGSVSVAGGGTTANLDMSQISSSASNNIPYFQLLRSA